MRVDSIGKRFVRETKAKENCERKAVEERERDGNGST